MQRKIFWRKVAEGDLAEAYLYLGADSPAAAERFVDAVQSSLQVIARHPEVGRLRAFRSPQSHSVRSRVVRGFDAYLIFYRLAGEDIEVLRILHGARDLPPLLGSSEG